MQTLLDELPVTQCRDTVRRFNWTGPAVYGLAFVVSIYLSICRSLYVATDDAYITYVFARNLAQHHEISWIVGGGHVYGSTTFLYCILLAACSLVGFSIPISSSIIGALSWAVASILLGLLVGRVTSKAFGVIATGLASVSLLPVVTSMGMETGLYTALVLGTCLAYAKEREAMASILAAFATLTRPDGGIIWCLVLAHFLCECYRARTFDKSSFVRLIAPFAVIITAFVAFCYVYFGAILPNSFFAKSIMPGYTRFSVWEYACNFALFGYEFLPDVAVPIYVTAYCITLLCGLFVVARTLSNRASVAFLFPVAHLSIYSLFGMPNSVWYYSPAYLVSYGLIAIGLYILSQCSYLVISRFSNMAPEVKRVVCAAPCALALVASYDFIRTDYATLLLDPWGAKFNRPYPEDYEVKFLTDVLREHFERNHIHNPTVMAFEVGNLAWGLEAKVYDILGLTAPDVVRFGGKKNPLYILEKYKPDYAVIVDLASYEPTATILESFEFNKDYSLMFSKRRALGDYYNVYERQPDKHLKKAWSVSDFGSPSYMSPGFSATTMKHAWRIDGHGPDPYAIYNVPAAVTQDCSLMCIDAASSEEGIMRVRWNVKANEPNERLQDLLVTGRGRQDLCISLPTNTRLENFRLDPIEGLQSIKLHEVDLYGEDCAKS